MLKKYLAIRLIFVVLGVVIGMVIFYYTRIEKENLPQFSETETREIKITAERFKYNPALLVVNKGEKIRLVIENLDTLHGIRIPELGIKGETTVEFTAAKSGEFVFYCNNFCGADHRQMQGKLVVE